MTGDRWRVERNYGAGWEPVFIGTESLARATYDRHLAGMWAGEVRLVRTADSALIAYARANRRDETAC
jgi:hypothetical protein